MVVSPAAFAVDGVLEINRASAANLGCITGDAPGLSVTIIESGSYRLTGNLTVSDENTHTIQVSIDNVTVDLNGFSILGPCTTTTRVGTGTGEGIAASGSSRVTVNNGSVQGMGGAGINLGGAVQIAPNLCATNTTCP
jgi:hypothetical protein